MFSLEIQTCSSVPASVMGLRQKCFPLNSANLSLKAKAENFDLKSKKSLLNYQCCGVSPEV